MEIIKDQAIEEAKKTLHVFDDFNFSIFDMYNDLIQNAVNAVMNMSFTSDHKVVIVLNCYFLSSDMDSAPTSWDNQQDLKSLEKYLADQNPDSDLILLTTGRLKGEKSLPLMGELKKRAQVVESAPLTDQSLMELGLRYVGEQKATIDKETLYELISRVNSDYMLMLRSLDKLLCYTKNIRIEDVELLVSPRLEDNVFSIVEALFKSDSDKAIKSFRDLRKSGMDTMRLLPVFASQLRFLYEIASLISMRKNDIDIAKELGCKPGRIMYAKRSLGNISKDKILKMMADLGEVEDHIKFDLDNQDTLMEMYFVNFRKNYIVSSKPRQY